MSKYLLSEPVVIRQIKSMQYRAQAIPMVLIAVSFSLGLVFKHSYIFGSLSILGLIWFLIVASRHRFKNRIIKPEKDNIYSPITGRVRDLKVSNGLRQITIHKGFMDQVELRCPVTGAFWQGDDLVVPQPKIRFTFQAQNLSRIPDSEMKSGNVIALITGKGNCLIHLAESIPILLNLNRYCEAGESRITLPNK
ncbi:MAG: hypothetical protein PHY41_02060 [Candidatus Cloacimonetes bacterium]|jgi:hypothetical protein|nr:hypothetical protein [Candidatus Cloacimonadota bacterium]MDY0298577.1 hypothetical protein [Candidatus Cloacimonadaceae bacterium]MCB5279027.1 hypothetical protein [Candidatus Cloacimonadota bacterium]MCK9332511.1 hypothetical protein [Candidatus Cloacimonadota bacterium]MDD2210609.1 hypothetical protein [Candidatus Cloacimonadota bacterium]